MKIPAALFVGLAIASGTVIASVDVGQHKVVIAHRGASGYLPEHTLPSKAAAYFMGVDYIEQDVVMTRDDRLVVLHDHYLDRVTNVEEVYPKRYRMVNGEKRWFAVDFDLDEIKGLQVTEGFTVTDDAFSKNKTTPVYDDRFPLWKSSFRVNTLEEEIEMIQGLNKSTGHNVGIYTEIKAPWFHRHEGKDISVAVLKVLKKYGYSDKGDKAYVQCFDPIETKRINDELMPALGMDLNVVQLIITTDADETMVYKDGKAVPYNYDWMFKSGAMKRIATYADGIGPSKDYLVTENSTQGHIVPTIMVKEAHEAGMVVHPWTLRREESQIPSYATGYDDMLRIYLDKVGVDGVFTDFPDRAVNYIRKQESKQG
ncbi:Glycerophosphodiester phosphodiesterase, periplasmic [invertebrate metagenome]|uniref:glycerophosphodiester phosphodiesterase n=1 Tax=invertebrate metagenome TaxID=1711999 RepID=A0A2H9T6B7_9ZZZZ